MAGQLMPDFEDSTLTTDQHGMLELLGRPRIIGYSVLEFLLEPPQYEGVPSIARAQRIHQACPVVNVLGRHRVVLPNGDVNEHDEQIEWC
ncbi:MAG: hypothetical protein EOO76_18945 [Novosphingobium sp.]|nr:MAG: hypothetical protein EOO76_18945 [Novosphingobium sp.]